MPLLSEASVKKINEQIKILGNEVKRVKAAAEKQDIDLLGNTVSSKKLALAVGRMGMAESMLKQFVDIGQMESDANTALNVGATLSMFSQLTNDPTRENIDPQVIDLQYQTPINNAARVLYDVMAQEAVSKAQQLETAHAELNKRHLANGAGKTAAQRLLAQRAVEIGEPVNNRQTQ